MSRFKTLRRLLFPLALLTTGVIAACGADEDAGTPPDADAAAFGGDGARPGIDGAEDEDGASTTDGAGKDASKDSSTSTDASVDAAGTDGADAAADANADLDAADAADTADAADAAEAAPPMDPDLPITPFPTTTPRLFGYTLTDAFPGTFLSGAMDMEWPAGSSQPFVLQRGGHIVRLLGGGARTLVLDFESKVLLAGEAGALGMALHPKFNDAVAPQRYVYVWYNTKTGLKQRLSRFTYVAATGLFDPMSELVMVEQTEQTSQHNGGRVRFGPDGFLYFGNGDDTRDAQTAQKLDAGLFSGLFRIDVDMQGGAVSHAPPRQPTLGTTQGYYIPNSNPFVGVANANEEYFALGFRNPYSFSFDKLTGAIWLGDVGDSWREEIDLVQSGSNYQWPFFEGTKRRQAGGPVIGVERTPTYDYPHWQIGDLASTMAGFIYRGAALPELQGKLIYTDWPVGRVWSLDTATATRTSLVETNYQNQPVGWGQDANGELYLMAWSKILKLVRDPAPAAVTQKLSDTHIFRNMTTLNPATSLNAYSIKSPLWSDGADKSRWVHVPAGQKAMMNASGTVTFPAGSLLVKHFELPASANPVGRTRRLETRVLVVGTDTTYGLTYRWNAAGTDADLVTEAVHEAIADAVPAQSRTWHFPSQGECWSCHREENRVLAFRGEQLNFTLPGGMNQLTALAAKNVFDGASIGASPAPIASPSDAAETIDARASAYLAANCAPCHHPGAAYLGGTTWNALPGVAANSRMLIGQPHHNFPMATAFGLTNAPLIAKGNPAGSILSARIHSVDRDLSMPPLGRSIVDPLGVSVIDQWITTLP